MPLQLRFPAIVLVVVAQPQVLDGWIWFWKVARRCQRTVGLMPFAEVWIGCVYVQLLHLVDERSCRWRRRISLRVISRTIAQCSLTVVAFVGRFAARFNQRCYWRWWRWTETRQLDNRWDELMNHIESLRKKSWKQTKKLESLFFFLTWKFQQLISSSRT